MICQSNTCTEIGIKINIFKGRNPEYNMKNHMITPNMKSWWEEMPYCLACLLLFIPPKPIDNLYDTKVMVITTKTCTFY